MSNLKRAKLSYQEQKSAENKACLKPGCCSFIAPLFGWYGGGGVKIDVAYLWAGNSGEGGTGTAEQATWGTDACCH